MRTAYETVIASEAKQSSFFRREKESWIASSLSLLAMTARYEFAFPRRDAPEVCVIFHPPGK
jgi:hypothetical protein